MKGASSLSLFKHKTGSRGPETKEVTWTKVNRSSDNGKAQNSGQQRLELELHVLGDKILATGKHSHFDSNLHLHVLSATLQEVADALHPLILNVVEMKHWEHVSGC